MKTRLNIRQRLSAMLRSSLLACLVLCGSVWAGDNDERWLQQFDRHIVQTTGRPYDQNRALYRSIFRELLDNAHEQPAPQRNLPLASILGLQDLFGLDSASIDEALAILGHESDDNARVLRAMFSTLRYLIENPKSFGGAFERVRNLDDQYGEQLHPYVRAQTLRRIAVLAHHAKRSDHAVKLETRLLNLPALRHRSFDYLVAMVKLELGAHYLLNDEIDLSLRYLREARQLLKPQDLPAFEPGILIDEGISIAKQGNAAAGNRLFEKAYPLAIQQNQRQLASQSLANMADMYLGLGQYAKALALAEQAVRVDANEKSIGYSLSVVNRGQAKIGLGRIEEGLQDVHEALSIELPYTSAQLRTSFVFDTAIYLERAKAWRHSWDFLQRYLHLHDEYELHNSHQSLLEPQEQFDSVQREQELSRLSQDLALERQRQAFDETVAVTVKVLVVFVGLSLLVAIHLMQKLRQKRNQLLVLGERLERMADEDPLTHSANRHRLVKEFAKRPAFEHWQGSLMMLDIDHFKHVNDTYGHAAGDAVLIAVANRLKASVRASDVIVRLGGEEFLILADKLSTTETQNLAQRLLHVLSDEPVMFEGQAIAITGSFGYAHFPLVKGGHAGDWERAMELIDSALYLAKQHGRNRAYDIEVMGRKSSSDDLGKLSKSLEHHWKSGKLDLVLVEPHAGA